MMRSCFVPIIYVFFVLFLVSCGPKSDPSDIYSFKLMTGEEIHTFLTVSNKMTTYANFERVPDRLYAIPTLEWVKKVYSPNFNDFLSNNNLKRFSDTVNDCDKFSQYAKTIGYITYFHTKTKPDESSLAIGEIDLLKDGVPYHAMNFFVVMDEFGDFKVIFYEPQTRKIIDLNLKEYTILFWSL